ncbi:hypothetical protein MAPG_11580 [Magnaporthiopsis poae ATCC 64411]|uniref:Zn(2)-C6 fungal-type domain-containing protein n=1 Tax=Magnaporthiopsis poae (strain ATCC 64411 / 73-15) TaxID=644358 RepID=A0A0C4EFM8_MAGP6|nr:hypothetical protein MAPG_11580 [Magnaporthiopsis poae ATCC 64411]
MAEHQHASAVVAHRQLPPHNPVGRAKRRKYTAVACDECRRRKLKCMPGRSAGGCQRCISRGLPACNFKSVRCEPADAAPRGSADDHETISSLRQDVEVLRNTLSEWMATAREHGDPHGWAQWQPNTPRDLPPATPAATLPARQPDTAAPRTETPEAAASTPMPVINGVAAPSSASGAPQAQGGSVFESGSAQQTSPPASNWSAPEEPRFIGPTRSAYSLEAGDRALSRLGVPTFDDNPLQSGQQTPNGNGAGTPRRRSASDNSDARFWEKCDAVEFARLIEVFREEVESVYPCLQTERLVRNSAELLQMGRMSEDAVASRAGSIGIKDLHLAKLALATATVIEGNGRIEEDSATTLVASVERSVLSVLKPSWELKDLQLLILLSIYYFHCDQDLLAWRTIGLAAREALVMGLHRKATLLDTFPDQRERDLAVSVFWVIYVLDRRWSFGTSLSFALVDRDIDAELPEPRKGPDCAYLQCMVGYGRLCSVLWDSLVPFGHHQGTSDTNPDETMRDLDIKAQEWLESIPSELRLRHPRLGLAARAQPPDSIQVLVHLNDSSDIYRRQQAAFNYFLLSALAVLFLAVANDPETFAAPCKKSLHSAIDLLRHLSRHSWGSRRLWRSVRGIIPRLRYLENRRNEERLLRKEKLPQVAAPLSSSQAVEGAAGVVVVGQGGSSGPGPDPNEGGGTDSTDATTTTTAGPPSMAPVGCAPSVSCAATVPPFASGGPSYDDTPGCLTTTPDFGSVSDELMELFETFEQGQPFAALQLQPERQQVDMGNLWGGFYNTPNSTSQDQGVMSWEFDWLIQ